MDVQLLLLLVQCVLQLSARSVEKLECPPPPADCSYNQYTGNYTQAYRVRGIKLFVKNQPNKEISYHCLSSNLYIDDLSLPKLGKSSSFTQVIVRNCGRPKDSYTKALQILNVTNFQTLSLFFDACSNETKPSSRNFESKETYSALKIKCKKIFTHLDLSFMEELLALHNVSLENVIIPPLPANNTLSQLTISNGSPRMSGQRWGGCRLLEHLTILDWKVNYLPDRWLAHCTKLVTVKFRRIRYIYSFPSEMFGSPFLSSLVVKECQLRLLSDDLAVGALNLTVLDLSDNFIEEFDTLFKSEQMRSVQYLDLSFNFASSISLCMLSALSSLRVLRVDELDVGSHCEDDRQSYLPSLTELWLGSSDSINPRWGGAMPSLRLLNLSFTDINRLAYNDIEIIRKWSWEVDLRIITMDVIIVYTKEDYENVIKSQSGAGSNGTGGRLWLDAGRECNCSWYWFARTLSRYPSYMELPGFACIAHSTHTTQSLHRLEHMSYERLVCAIECVVGCRCYEYYDGYTSLVCDGAGLRSIPTIRNVKHVNMANNHIDTLTLDHFPHTLRSMDLSYNQLSSIDAPVLHRMFGSGEVEYRLAGNLIPCSCNNSAFITTLQHNKQQVKDYYNVSCIGGDLIDTVDMQTVCFREHLPVYAGVGASVLLFLSLILVVLYYRYRNEILVLMYSSGWFSCCLTEDELDKDKRYDVFISFAYGDSRFVSESLLPRLEGPPHEFRVCVHYRDWVPGNWVPALIAHSVAHSRRTIIVLSSNFLSSVWALLEFRTAHIQALKDGRVRLIVLLLDDVTNDPRIDHELNAYLATNTYIRWGDALFWNKLLYALPHRRVARPAAPAPDDVTTQHSVNRAHGERVMLMIREDDPPIELRRDTPLELLLAHDTTRNAH